MRTVLPVVILIFVLLTSFFFESIGASDISGGPEIHATNCHSTCADSCESSTGHFGHSAFPVLRARWSLDPLAKSLRLAEESVQPPVSPALEGLRRPPKA